MSGPGSGDPFDAADRGDERRTSDVESMDEFGESTNEVEGSADEFWTSTDEARGPGASDGRPSGEDESGDSRPPRSKSASDESASIEDDGLVRWFFKTDNGTVVAIRDVLSSVAIVAVVGLLLFGVSGIWPPLVAVESGSMEPHLERGDLVFVVDEGRFAGDGAVAGTGVVTHERAETGGYDKFGSPGDVIIFMPNGNPAETPVIHRAHLWVEEDENWVEEADPEIVGEATCEQVPTCPAPHDGFVTKGDNNGGYDQHGGAQTDVVRPEWVTGKAVFRIPWLGHIRLGFDAVRDLLVADPTMTPIGEPSALDGEVALEAGLVGIAGTAALVGGRRRGRR